MAVRLASNPQTDNSVGAVEVKLTEISGGDRKYSELETSYGWSWLSFKVGWGVHQHAHGSACLPREQPPRPFATAMHLTQGKQVAACWLSEQPARPFATTMHLTQGKQIAACWLSQRVGTMRRAW